MKYLVIDPEEEREREVDSWDYLMAAKEFAEKEQARDFEYLEPGEQKRVLVQPLDGEDLSPHWAVVYYYLEPAFHSEEPGPERIEP